DLSKPLQNLSFTLLPNEVGGIAIFAWLKDADLVCRAFVSSLISIPDDRKSDALVHFVFDSFENNAIQPNWWDDLPDASKKELEQRMLNWTDVRPWDSSALVVRSTHFADWEYRDSSWL